MTTLDTRRSQAYTDDRAHVFHSWSAQGALTPLVVAGGRGRVVLGRGRQPLPRLLVAARQHQHRPPAPQAGGGHPGAGRPSCARSPRSTPTTPAARRPGSSPSWPPATSTWCSSPTAAPRPPRTPCAWPGCTPAATRCWPPTARYHGATAGSITLTGDPRRWPSEPGDARRHPLLGAVPLPLAVPRHHRGRGVRAGAAAPRRHDHGRGPAHRGRHHPGDGGGHERHPRAARRLPRRRAGAVRPVRHRDDRRRGDGRLRALRRVVRRRPLGRHPRPHLLRQGRELRLRAARRRRHQPPHRRHVHATGPIPGGLTYSGHVARLRGRRGLDPASSRRRASSSTPARSAPT